MQLRFNALPLVSDLRGHYSEAKKEASLISDNRINRIVFEYKDKDKAHMRRMDQDDQDDVYEWKNWWIIHERVGGSERIDPTRSSLMTYACKTTSIQ